MGVNSGPSASPDGLIYCLDPANPRSYPGTGTGVTELSRVSANPTLNSGVTYYANPKGYFEFDGVNDNIPFTLTNFGTTLTIEVWAKLKSFSNGMIFGFNKYNVFSYNGAIGYNTANSDQYGLTSTQVTNLGLLNQWKHYVFEMRSDVAYTNNKIYVNAQLQTLSQVLATELSSNRDFNSGNGRINCWLYDNGYFTPVDLAIFRVYNRALTQAEITNNYNAFRKRFFPEENIATNGLVLQLDAGKSLSYSGIGNTAYDISGVGNTASLINGVSFSTTNGGSFVFDGVNDYINFFTDVLDIGTSDFSVNVWFKTGAAQTQTFVANQVSNGWNGFNFGMNSSGYLTPTVDWGNSQQYGAIQSASTYNDNTWKNATFVLIGSTVSNWKLFINGVRVSAPLEPGSVSTISGIGISNAVSLTIGTRAFGSYCNGSISQVQIYNRALSADEILQNYNAFKGRYGLS